ncbi:hypothetical protein ACFV3R_33075 [Streptomyces sp. NPDC059740]|uniref:hypothetical protein n=1 Tax=Streptomyces sp. NPDC059740 TaxID=3346926 RepID=UPI00365A767F
MTHRDRQGQEIDLIRWAELWNDMAYRVVAEDQVDGILVRTVWEGADDVVGAMFATGVSHDGANWRNAQTEARTEAEAYEQHRKVVDGLSAQQTS